MRLDVLAAKPSMEEFYTELPALQQLTGQITLLPSLQRAVQRSDRLELSTNTKWVRRAPSWPAPTSPEHYTDSILQQGSALVLVSVIISFFFVLKFSYSVNTN